MKYEKYETVIGLEIHVQLATKSKAFCADDARFGAAPNTHISTISLGHPGTLPKVNKTQIEYAVRLGLALGSRINLISYFDRKNYFYADLPKGYQITQDNQPICIGGTLDIETEAGKKTIRIHHIHMEEDAGKSMHDMEPKNSYIDLNRAGVPLLEIVSEPDLRSAEEVDAYMSAMRQLVRYLGVSDGNMEQGSMRCDCNVSVRLKGSEQLGNRCEIKNLNSMRYARRAIAYEVKRQIDLIENGGKVIQSTLNFDPQTGVTSPLREKEDAHDYRYFPEPDLPPVVLTEDYVEGVKKDLAPLPWALKDQFIKVHGLSEYDANLLTEERATAEFFIVCAEQVNQKKALANLMINKIIPYCNEHEIALSTFPIAPAGIAEFIALIDSGKVSNTIAYQKIFPELVSDPSNTALNIAEKHNLIQRSDSNFLADLIQAALDANPDKVKAYKNGKKGLLGFFMGEVMRNSKGKADPKATNSMIREMLEK